MTEQLAFLLVSLKTYHLYHYVSDDQIFGFFSDFACERKSLLIFESRPLLLAIPTFNQDTAAISAGRILAWSQSLP